MSDVSSPAMRFFPASEDASELAWSRRFEVELDAINAIVRKRCSGWRLRNVSCEDVCQEVLLRIWVSRDRLSSATRGDLRRFAIKTTTFVLLEASRASRKWPNPLATGFEIASNDSIAFQDLLIAIAELPEDKGKQALLLRLQEFTFDEIADELGVALGTAFNLVHRAQRLLRRGLS